MVECAAQRNGTSLIHSDIAGESRSLLDKKADCNSGTEGKSVTMWTKMTFLQGGPGKKAEIDGSHGEIRSCTRSLSRTDMLGSQHKTQGVLLYALSCVCQNSEQHEAIRSNSICFANGCAR
jgi:hypothetical protein